MQTDAEAAGKLADIGLRLAGEGFFLIFIYFLTIEMVDTYARLAAARNPVFASRDANLACFRSRGCEFIR